MVWHGETRTNWLIGRWLGCEPHPLDFRFLFYKGLFSATFNGQRRLARFDAGYGRGTGRSYTNCHALQMIVVRGSRSGQGVV